MKLFDKLKNLFQKKSRFNWDKNKKTTAFFMDVDTALEFYQRVYDRKATTPKEKDAILKELAEEGRMKSIIQTNRTKEQLLADYTKEYNVLHVKKKEQGEK